MLLYLDQEGRGTGIASKMRAYGFQCDGIGRIELVTNNPRKIELLRASGVDVVGRAAVYGEVTPQNRAYLQTKADRSGHLIDVDELAERA